MIAFIWQKDWEDLASIIALRLIQAQRELSVYVYGGQLPKVLSDAMDTVKASAATKSKLPMRAAKSIEEATKGASTVITLLSCTEELEDVYFGRDGILQSAKPASLFVDLSTSSPQLAKELYAMAAVHDFRFVEAPVSGAVDFASSGDFKLYVAGESDSLDLAMPVLQDIAGKEVYRVGLTGCGTALKLAEQIALAGAIMGLVEAYSFAGVFGCTPKETTQIMNNSPYSAVIAQAFGQRVLDEDFYYGLDLTRFCLDLESALSAADEAELALPGLETAHQLYDLLVLVGGAKMGIHTLSLVYRDEKLCAKHGLNWALAEKAMDLYERDPSELGDDYYYDELDDGDSELGISLPRENPPGTQQFFSHN